MPNSKLKDNEIKKALTICSITGASCKDCPAFVKDGRSKCKKVLIGALDIIGHLQDQNKDLAETVHNLTIEKDALFDKVEELKAEIERLKNAYKQVAWERDIFAEDMKQEIKKDCSYLMLDIKTIKAEAIKEFAEKVKKESVTRLHYGTNLELEETECVEVEDIENLLEETVSENK